MLGEPEASAKDISLTSLKTLNGLWNRLTQATLKQAIQFQIDEKRFRLSI